MGFRRTVVGFLFQTIVGAALTKFGEHVGDALGARLGKKLNPEPESSAEAAGDSDQKQVVVVVNTGAPIEDVDLSDDQEDLPS